MSTSADINALFQAAQSSGALSTASMQALTIATGEERGRGNNHGPCDVFLRPLALSFP